MKKLLNPVTITLSFFIFVQLLSLLLLLTIAKSKNDEHLKREIQQDQHIDMNIADITIERQNTNDE